MEENNTRKNLVDDSPFTPNAPEVAKEIQTAPTQAADQTVTPTNEVVTKTETPSVSPAAVAPASTEATHAPEEKPAASSQEEKKEEVKTEDKKEEVKKEEPKKEQKKKSYKGTIFLLFLLLLIIVGLYLVMGELDKLKKVKKGVTDLSTIVVPEKEPEKLADSKKVIDALDPSVQESIVNFLLQDEETNYINYLNSLDNGDKLYLADLFKNNSITLDSIKTNLESKFGVSLGVEGENLYDLKNKSKILYEFNPTTVMFEKKIELGSVDYKPFKIDGELMILEYDDPVGTKEEYSITVYSAFLIRNNNVESIRNKADTLKFDESLSIDNIKNNILTYYSDHKEEFDRITYKFKKNNKHNKFNLIDVIIG